MTENSYHGYINRECKIKIVKCIDIDIQEDKVQRPIREKWLRICDKCECSVAEPIFSM